MDSTADITILYTGGVDEYFYLQVAPPTDTISTDSIGLLVFDFDSIYNSGIIIYPNPFNSSVKIMVSTPSVSPPYQGGDVERSKTEGVNIAIYDVRGNVVGTPYPDKSGFVPLNKGDRNRASAKVSGGSASSQGIFIWQPEKSVASGIYLIRFDFCGGFSVFRSVLYLK